MTIDQHPAPRALRHGAAGVAAASAAAGLWIALHHPLAPALAAFAFCAWALAVRRWPALWHWLLPAALPVLGLAPWSGWTGVDEFDLAVLACAAGGYAARAGRDAVPMSTARAYDGLAATGLALACIAGLAIGLARFDNPGFGWFDGYDSPLNSIRVFKGSAAALLLLPLLPAHADARGLGLRLATGLCIGTVIVALASWWERIAFSGLWNPTFYYRTTALFWEMHVGGAAIEVFLVLGLPFAAMLLARARGVLAGVTALGLAGLLAYACLSTLSRSLYAALAVAAVPAAWMVAVRRSGTAGPTPGQLPRMLLFAVVLVAAGSEVARLAAHWAGYAGVIGVVMLAMLVAAARVAFWSGARWRVLAGLAIALVLTAELGAVREGASVLTRRFDSSVDDAMKRVAHWTRALERVDGLFDRALGRGLGRFPVDYVAGADAVEWPGAFRIVAAGDGRFARIAGPPSLEGMAGVFGMAQRLGPLLGGIYTLRFDARAERVEPLEVSLCEKHLIYEAECGFALVHVLPGAWRRYEARLDARVLQRHAGVLPRPVLLALASAATGGMVEVDNLVLKGAAGVDLVANGDFAQDAARWFLAGRYYFLPWHADSLVVELLFERGVAGLLLFAWLFARALRAWGGRAAAGEPFAPAHVAALIGCLALGTLGSVLDVPRNAFVLTLLLLLRPAGAPGGDAPSGTS